MHKGGSTENRTVVIILFIFARVWQQLCLEVERVIQQATPTAEMY